MVFLKGGRHHKYVRVHNQITKSNEGGSREASSQLPTKTVRDELPPPQHDQTKRTGTSRYTYVRSLSDPIGVQTTRSLPFSLTSSSSSSSLNHESHHAKPENRSLSDSSKQLVRKKPFGRTNNAWIRTNPNPDQREKGIDFPSQMSFILTSNDELKKEKTSTSSSSSPSRMSRRGCHKLICQPATTNTIATSDNKKPLPKYGQKNFLDGRKHLGNVKRIKLSTSTTMMTTNASTNDSSKASCELLEEQHIANEHSNGDSMSNPTTSMLTEVPLSFSAKDASSTTTTTTTQFLTESAYLELCPKTKLKKKPSNYIAAQQRTTKLVRLSPNEYTPICPNGKACSLSTCTKRHDIPIEATKPNCQFFERNGMCWKGPECPFRHVKVSKDAALCAKFQKFGYCEEEDCSLRHVWKKSKNKMISS